MAGFGNVGTMTFAGFGTQSGVAVTFGDNVTLVPKWMFRGVGYVTSVEFSDSVETIGVGAFKDQTGLTSVSFPSSVETISSDAFSGCTGMEFMEFPSSLSSLGSYAFRGIEFYDGETPLSHTVSNLAGRTFVMIDGKLSVRTVPAVDTIFNDGTLKYSVTSSSPLAVSVIGFENATKNLVIPDEVYYRGFDIPVKSISKQAFYGSDTIVTADLGSVTSVGVKAFANCTKLKSVSVGDSLKTISAYGFYRCVRLVDIDLESSAKTMNAIGSFAFYKCEKLAAIAIPSYVKTIGDDHPFSQAFADTKGNALDVLPESLRGYVYRNVDGVFVRQAGPEVGHPFSCGNLHYEVIASLPAEAMITGYTGTVKALVVPDSVEDEGYVYDVVAIGDYAFNGNKSLRSADLSGIERIGKQAFYSCTALKTVKMEDVRSIGVKAFAYCSAMTEADVGEGLKTISAYAFTKCRSLQSFEFPDSVKTIGSYAFYKCSALQGADLGPMVKTIGSYAFASCPSISEVSLPSALKKLGSTSFSGLVFQDADGNVLKQPPRPSAATATPEQAGYSSWTPELNTGLRPLSYCDLYRITNRRLQVRSSDCAKASLVLHLRIVSSDVSCLHTASV